MHSDAAPETPLLVSVVTARELEAKKKIQRLKDLLSRINLFCMLIRTQVLPQGVDVVGKD